jgi:hypothetical protein
MHQGGGGDNWAVTYQTTNELAISIQSHPRTARRPG